MYGHASRGAYDRRNAFFKPIEDDEPVSMEVTSSGEASASAAARSEEDLLMALHDEVLKDRQRMKILSELILSERDYVKDLETINSVFLQPLRKQRILPESDVGKLFTTLPAIISLNKALLTALTTTYAQAEESNRGLDATVVSLVQQSSKAASVGRGFGPAMASRGIFSVAHLKRKECLVADAIQQMASYLAVYTSYSTRYADAVAIIKRNLAANPDFVSFLKEAKAVPECRGRDIKTLLLRPIQRLCQYISILESLMQHTPRTHGDYVPLGKATSQITEVARHAEEALLALKLGPTAEIQPSTTTTAASVAPTKPLGNRRRKSLSTEDRTRIERRRDGLAEIPHIFAPPTEAPPAKDSSSSHDSSARQPKRQVSWKCFRLSLSPGGESSKAIHKSSSMGLPQGESLQVLLDREKSSSSPSPSDSESDGSGGRSSTRSRALRRGGSLTHSAGVTSKAQPRRVKSSVSLCRLGDTNSSTTTSLFKTDSSNMVC